MFPRCHVFVQNCRFQCIVVKFAICYLPCCVPISHVRIFQRCPAVQIMQSISHVTIMVFVVVSVPSSLCPCLQVFRIVIAVNERINEMEPFSCTLRRLNFWWKCKLFNLCLCRVRNYHAALSSIHYYHHYK